MQSLVDCVETQKKPFTADPKKGSIDRNMDFLESVSVLSTGENTFFSEELQPIIMEENTPKAYDFIVPLPDF